MMHHMIFLLQLVLVSLTASSTTISTRELQSASELATLKAQADQEKKAKEAAEDKVDAAIHSYDGAHSALNAAYRTDEQEVKTFEKVAAEIKAITTMMDRILEIKGPKTVENMLKLKNIRKELADDNAKGMSVTYRDYCQAQRQSGNVKYFKVPYANLVNRIDYYVSAVKRYEAMKSNARRLKSWKPPLTPAEEKIKLLEKIRKEKSKKLRADAQKIKIDGETPKLVTQKNDHTGDMNNKRQAFEAVSKEILELTTEIESILKTPGKTQISKLKATLKKLESDHAHGQSQTYRAHCSSRIVNNLPFRFAYMNLVSRIDFYVNAVEQEAAAN